MELSMFQELNAALFAEMLSLANDGRYPAIPLVPQQRREKTLRALTSQVALLERDLTATAPPDETVAGFPTASQPGRRSNALTAEPASLLGKTQCTNRSTK